MNILRTFEAEILKIIKSIQPLPPPPKLEVVYVVYEFHSASEAHQHSHQYFREKKIRQNVSLKSTSIYLVNMVNKCSTTSAAKNWNTLFFVRTFYKN